MNLTDDTSVGVGAEAPDFQLESNTGNSWRLSDHIGSVVAILFYSKDETLVCTRQLCSVRDNWNDYLKTRALVIGVSPGKVEEHNAFAQHHRLPIPILADADRSVTNTYGFHWLLPTLFTRAIVVIDAKGIIRSRRVMLRMFRPTDRSVITSIYAARADAMNAELETLRKKRNGRSF